MPYQRWGLRTAYGDFVVFRGASGGFFGLYILDLASGVVEPLITIEDTLDGKNVGSVNITDGSGRPGPVLSGNQLVFRVDFEDGTKAIYLATFSTGAARVPSLSTPALLALTLVLLAVGSVMFRRAKLESGLAPQ
jgi:hypothetical protein